MQVINSIQKQILGMFGSIPDSQYFYLAGGTSLAEFYLKHRQSNDLDFFTSTPELIVPFSQHLEKLVKAGGMQVQRQRSIRSFVELLVKNNEQETIIHLGEDSAFRFKESKEFPEYPGLKIDSLEDIASNKLLALFGRASLRDFIDIYFLIGKQLFTKNQLIEKAKIKDPGFDLYWLAVAFERIKTYTADSTDMLLLLEPVDFKDLSAFFDKWREEISKDLK